MSQHCDRRTACAMSSGAPRAGSKGCPPRPGERGQARRPRLGCGYPQGQTALARQRRRPERWQDACESRQWPPEGGRPVMIIVVNGRSGLGFGQVREDLRDRPTDVRVRQPGIAGERRPKGGSSGVDPGGVPFGAGRTAFRLADGHICSKVIVWPLRRGSVHISHCHVVRRLKSLAVAVHCRERGFQVVGSLDHDRLCLTNELDSHSARSESPGPHADHGVIGRLASNAAETASSRPAEASSPRRIVEAATWGRGK